MQLVLHRLLTVASKCADGVIVVVLDVVEDELLLPPPQEARRKLNGAKSRMKSLDFMLLIAV